MRIPMSNISLTQVTALVAIVCMASFFVNADDELTHNRDDSSSSVVENSLDDQVAKETKASSNRFTFSSLDTDKNGKLSHQEVIAGKSEWLANSFKQIDVNTDQLLTERELVDFVSKKNAPKSF